MRCLALCFLVFGVSACAPTAEPPAPAPLPTPEELASCGGNLLMDQIGQPADSVDLSAAKEDVRLLPPGSIMTMDHRPRRMNADLDEAGLITRLWCG
ncbi:I78 family peptidase inhibitor [Roseovarius sp. 2305UL8-3]|uniref:I78 family peptidase inhibitor n=1 Tax=Roseovarius conchicola TaxID=3121636 RepID=UPI0035294F93